MRTITKKIDLKEGDMICPKCKGLGCKKCYDEGQLDWIENVVGKKKPLRHYGDIIYQDVSSSPRIKKSKVGDIVQFYHWSRERTRYCYLPRYASKEFGVITLVYRLTKYKGMIFRDYGREIVLLTGKKRGIRKLFYITKPWEVLLETNPRYQELKNIVTQMGL